LFRRPPSRLFVVAPRYRCVGASPVVLIIPPTGRWLPSASKIVAQLIVPSRTVRFAGVRCRPDPGLVRPLSISSSANPATSAYAWRAIATSYAASLMEVVGDVGADVGVNPYHDQACCGSRTGSGTPSLSPAKKPPISPADPGCTRLYSDRRVNATWPKIVSMRTTPICWSAESKD